MKKSLIAPVVLGIIVVVILLKIVYTPKAAVVKAPPGASASVKQCIEDTVTTGDTPDAQLTSSEASYKNCKAALAESKGSEKGLVLDKLVAKGFSLAIKSAKVSRNETGSNEVLDDLKSTMEQNGSYTRRTDVLSNIEQQRKFIQEKVLTK